MDTLFLTSDKYIVRVVSSYATPVRATASAMLAWPVSVPFRAKKSISLPITTAKSAKRREPLKNNLESDFSWPFQIKKKKKKLIMLKNIKPENIEQIILY